MLSSTVSRCWWNLRSETWIPSSWFSSSSPSGSRWTPRPMTKLLHPLTLNHEVKESLEVVNESVLDQVRK